MNSLSLPLRPPDRSCCLKNGLYTLHIVLPNTTLINSIFSRLFRKVRALI